MMLRRASISVRAGDVADSDILSEIHAGGFRRGWSGAEIEALIVQPGVHTLIADYRPAIGRTVAAGFCLYRIAADEAEVLSIAVLPNCRRRGVARRLLEETLRHLYREGVKTLHLEVEEENEAAMRLYRRLEFTQSGERPAYYSTAPGRTKSAVVMQRQLR